MITKINDLLTEVLMQITEQRFKVDINLSSDVLAELTPAQAQLSKLMSTVSLPLFTFHKRRSLIWSSCYTPVDLIYGLIAHNHRDEIPLENIYNGSFSNHEFRKLLSSIGILNGYELNFAHTDPYDDEMLNSLKILKIETILLFDKKSLKIQMLNKGGI